MIPIITGAARTRNPWGFLAAFLVVAVLASACDKLPLLAPQGSTITVTAASVVVQANGSTELRATVIEQGGTPPQNGTLVTFSTNLGAITPMEARTQNGVATVQFVANGQSGRASVRAVSGGVSSEPLEITIGAAAAQRLSVSASPTSVPSTGGTTTITAIVLDANGNPLGGVPVTFTTTAGTLGAAVVNTDFTGAARTTLTTSRDATVSANAGGAATAQVTVAISARPTVTVALAGNGVPAVGAITTFTINATPGTGGAPLQNIVIDYGDGSSDDLGSAASSAQHVYDDDGTYTVRVTATDTSGSSASASTVIVVQPLIVAVSLTETSGNTATLEATVSPPGSTIASYSWNFGDGTSQTTGTGTTSHTYAAAGTYTVRVTARTSTGETASGTTSVRVP